MPGTRLLCPDLGEMLFHFAGEVRQGRLEAGVCTEHSEGPESWHRPEWEALRRDDACSLPHGTPLLHKIACQTE